MCYEYPAKCIPQKTNSTYFESKLGYVIDI